MADNTLPEEKNDSLINKLLLAKNSAIYISGRILPLIVGFFTIPFLIQELGTERFGILTIVWIFIGYFSLFNLGLGRALVKFISDLLGKGEDKYIPSTTWTAVIMIAIIGGGIAGIIYLLSNWIVYSFLDIPAHLYEETILSIKYTSIAIPFAITAQAFKSFLQSYQRFDLITSFQTTGGILNYLAPLFILYVFNASLSDIVALLLGIKILQFFAFLAFSIKQNPDLIKRFSFDSTYIKPLFQYGSWVTISDLVGPLMDHLDKIVVGSLLTVTAVTFYSTPLEVILRLNFIPSALVSVLFPAMSFSFSNNPRQGSLLFLSGIKSILVIIFPIVLFIILFAEEGLYLWVGQEFSNNSFYVTLIFGFCLFFHSMAPFPLSYLQSINKHRFVALIHLTDLLFFVVLLYILIPEYGILGAAISRLFKILLDLSLLGYNALSHIDISIFKLFKFILPLLAMLLFSLSILYFDVLFYKIATFVVFLSVHIYFSLTYFIPRSLLTSARSYFK